MMFSIGFTSLRMLMSEGCNLCVRAFYEVEYAQTTDPGGDVFLS